MAAAHRLRRWLFGLLLAAAVLSVVARAANSRGLGWVALALFACAVVVWVKWRAAVRAVRRGRVFDREAKTVETRPGPDE